MLGTGQPSQSFKGILILFHWRTNESRAALQWVLPRAGSGHCPCPLGIGVLAGDANRDISAGSTALWGVQTRGRAAAHAQQADMRFLCCLVATRSLIWTGRGFSSNVICIINRNLKGNTHNFLKCNTWIRGTNYTRNIHWNIQNTQNTHLCSLYFTWHACWEAPPLFLSHFPSTRKDCVLVLLKYDSTVYAAYFPAFSEK